MLGGSDVVLVTGGTGFTGSVLVDKLCRLGCKVRVLARPTSDRSALSQHEIEWFDGDVFDAETARAAADNVDYIFHVAGAFRDTKLSDEIYERVHVESTRLLAKAAARNPGFKRFLLVSTVGVFGNDAKAPLDERAPYNPSDVYQRTKAEAEQWLIDFAAKESLAYVVIRPAAIYGPKDRRLLKLFRMAKLPAVPIFGRTQGLYHLIHVDDLARFMMLAADHPQTLNEIFICGNPTPTSIRGIITTVAEHLGREPRFVRLPAWPLFMLGAACEQVFKPLNVEPPLHRRRVAFFTADRAFDTRKMHGIASFECRYTNESGLTATADWYRQHQWL